MKSWLIVLLLWQCHASAVELLQNTEARKHYSLNGQWKVIVDAYDVGDKRQSYNDASAQGLVQDKVRSREPVI